MKWTLRLAILSRICGRRRPARRWSCLLRGCFRAGNLSLTPVKSFAGWRGVSCAVVREVSNHLCHRLSALHPRRLLNLRRQRLDDFEAVMARAARARLENGFLITGQLARQLSIRRPAARLKRERERIRQLTELAAERVRRNYGRRQGKLDRLGEALRLLSPLNVLERGYSITRDAESGRLIDSVGDVKKGGRVATTIRDGEVISEVKDWQRNEREDS